MFTDGFAASGNSTWLFTLSKELKCIDFVHLRCCRYSDFAIGRRLLSSGLSTAAEKQQKAQPNWRRPKSFGWGSTKRRRLRNRYDKTLAWKYERGSWRTWIWPSVPCFYSKICGYFSSKLQMAEMTSHTANTRRISRNDLEYKQSGREKKKPLAVSTFSVCWRFSWRGKYTAACISAEEWIVFILKCCVSIQIWITNRMDSIRGVCVIVSISCPESWVASEETAAGPSCGDPQLISNHSIWANNGWSTSASWNLNLVVYIFPTVQHGPNNHRATNLIAKKKIQWL